VLLISKKHTILVLRELRTLTNLFCPIIYSLCPFPDDKNYPTSSLECTHTIASINQIIKFDEMVSRPE
jgi:hypothetical protein